MNKKNNKKYELSIVIPCYNELKSIPLLIERYKYSKNEVNFQLVLVDNGSGDATWDYLKEISKKEKFIKIIKIEKNVGYGHGIHKGLLNCDSEVIGWSHGDLQCSPEDVFNGYKIYRKINNKKVLVKGHRRYRDWKSLILSSCFSIYSTLILWKIFDDINGQPKIFHKNLFRTFRIPPKEFSYDLYVQYKAKKNRCKVRYFYVNFEKRIFGFSSWAYSTISKLSTIKGFIRDAIKMRVRILK